jgi:hypothetical protein
MAKMKASGSLPAAPMDADRAVFEIPQGMRDSFDPLELLPPVAAEKVQKLREHAAEMRRLVPSFDEQQQREMPSSASPGAAGAAYPRTQVKKLEEERTLKRLLDPA